MSDARKRLLVDDDNAQETKRLKRNEKEKARKIAVKMEHDLLKQASAVKDILIKELSDNNLKLKESLTVLLNPVLYREPTHNVSDMALIDDLSQENVRLQTEVEQQREEINKLKSALSEAQTGEAMWRDMFLQHCVEVPFVQKDKLPNKTNSDANQKSPKTSTQGIFGSSILYQHPIEIEKPKTRSDLCP